MSGQRIDLAALRRDIPPETGDPSDDIVVLNTAEALALVEAVEAARRAKPYHRRGDRFEEAAYQRLVAALAPFVFGDEEDGKPSPDSGTLPA